MWKHNAPASSSSTDAVARRGPQWAQPWKQTSTRNDHRGTEHTFGPRLIHPHACATSLHPLSPTNANRDRRRHSHVPDLAVASRSDLGGAYTRALADRLGSWPAGHAAQVHLGLERLDLLDSSCTRPHPLPSVCPCSLPCLWFLSFLVMPTRTSITTKLGVSGAE